MKNESSNEYITTNSNLCFICRERTACASQDEKECLYCGEPVTSVPVCTSGHVVCRTCETRPAMALIECHCVRTSERDPLTIIELLMMHPGIRFGGADHHYLLPAALLAAWCNTREEHGKIAQMLHEARQLAECVHEGRCGDGQHCGAATGAGIFFTVITKTSEYSDFHRHWSERIVERCLQSMNGDGRSRCCKQDSLHAVRETVRFLNETHGVLLTSRDRILCGMSHLNKDCLATSCPFSNVAQHRD
jgi:hypothetical protein